MRERTKRQQQTSRPDFHGIAKQKTVLANSELPSGNKTE